ncbi:MAG: FtsQ-type POTRA domain-containing protein [Eubacteriales bacterium]|nr:FtsQ-type POTRA domain-containing protein [Eubacteriales bacterium]
MEKKQSKKSATKKNNKSRAKADSVDRNLGDLGLEPPKIYREPQRNSLSPNQRSAKNTNLTRNEKRAKQTKKRKKRNKMRKILVWICVILFVAAVAVVLSLTVFFHINNVTVKGNEKYTTEEILAQCTIDKGENLFMADTDSAAERLEQTLPYIYDAQIKRKLPDTIEIKITDAKAEYSIKNKDKTYILLDDNFKVLELNAEKAQGIRISKAEIKTAVAGTKIEFKNTDVGECLETLALAVKENDFDEITSIYSNNISDNYVVYDGRIKFKLGNCDDVQKKIYQGLAACEQLNESSPNVKGTMTISGDKSIYFTEENA